MNKPIKAGSANKSKTYIEDAYRRIKQMIFERKLVPGQKLVYADLAKALEMSQTPIINALNRLEQEGFVASEVFRGFYVRPIDPAEVWDNFGVREALETYAVRQAIEAGHIEKMNLLAEKLEEYAAHMPERYTRKKFKLDANFHIQIAEMTNNRVLKYLLRRNLEHIYLRGPLDDYNSHRMKIALDEHRQLVDHMKKKDIQGSLDIIQRHIRGARDCVIECLSREEEEDFS